MFLSYISLFLLIYADDMVFFSESVQEFQDMFNALYEYTSDGINQLILEKTQILIFINSGTVRHNEKFIKMVRK